MLSSTKIRAGRVSGTPVKTSPSLRRWSLNLIKADQRLAKRSLKARRKNAGWDNNCLLYLLGINLDA